MIKKILATIGLLALLALPVEAVGMGGVGGGISSPQYWKLSGTALSPIVATWTVSVPAGISFGASTMTGNLNMGGFNILNARNVFLDADSNSGIWSSADNTVGVLINSVNVFTVSATAITSALGVSLPSLTTASNGTLAIVPNGTGITRIGDAYTTPLSLGALNDNLLVTKDLEVGDNIFTGGITTASNRGDVPYIAMTSTSACTIGTAQSLPIIHNGLFMGTFYSECDGAGGVQNRELRTPAIRNYGQLSTTKLTLPNNTLLPTTCVVGEVFLDTDSDDCADTAGGDGALCICKSANTWVLLNNI